MGHDLISNEQKAKILELAIKALDGDILPEETKELERYISSSKALAAYYSICIKMHLSMIELETSHRLSRENSNPALDREFWQMLAIHEQTSPEVEIPREEPPREYVSTIKREKYEYKIRRSSVYAIAASIAAIILIVLFVRYVPPKGGIKVAQLTDSINARWADNDRHMEIGTYLASGKESLLLRKGLVELQFDNDARITLEGPAEFQIITADQIDLQYGRLYANIPPGALGFTVTTPNSKIIDLGTKFGVEAGLNNITELHVLQGKTTLISGNKQHKASLQVTEGIAEKISGENGHVSRIACDRNKFVRKIHSRDGHIWRGENVSLTSLVAGRNGFQEVGSLIGLNPASGKYSASIIASNRTSKQPYNLVTGSDFIDGVFVPDGGVEQASIPVTSMGHTFKCPNTKGAYTHEIAAYKGSIEGQSTTIQPAIFNGKKIENDPVVLLHSNIGITLDLQAIRESLPGLKLKDFKGWGGLTEALNDLQKNRPDIDFWILVDGQIKYEKKKMTLEDNSVSFNIELNPTDRFLTLIVTDGLRVEDGKREFPFSNDFFYLIDPELTLTENF